MSQTERIRYRISGYNFTEISKGKGAIEYQLIDDFGNERTVTAKAKINLFKKISSIQPIYHRELPLIQALAQKKLNDSIIVDFSEFNKKHPRGCMRKQRITVPSIKMRSTGTSEITDLASIFDNKIRLLQLLIFSIAGFVILSVLMDKI